MGVILAQLVAISLLEKSGAIVELGNELVSDGTATNRKLWTELGISGQKEKVKSPFDHPLDSELKIYI